MHMELNAHCIMCACVCLHYLSSFVCLFFSLFFIFLFSFFYFLFFISFFNSSFFSFVFIRFPSPVLTLLRSSTLFSLLPRFSPPLSVCATLCVWRLDSASTDTISMRPSRPLRHHSTGSSRREEERREDSQARDKITIQQKMSFCHDNISLTR